MTPEEIRLTFNWITAMAESSLKELLHKHGGEYEFDESTDLIVAGQLKHGEGTEDIRLTRICLDEESVLMYGYPYRSYSDEEQPLDYLEPTYYTLILDAMSNL